MIRQWRICRLRYPLWMLFALTAAVAAFFSWLCAFRQECLAEQDLANAHEFSSSCQYRGPTCLSRFLMGSTDYQHVVAIGFTGSSRPSDGLHALKSFAHLEELYVKSDEITDTDMSVLRELPRLRILEIESSGVTGEFAAYLSECPSLRAVTVWGLHIDKCFLDAVSELPDLELLQLLDCDIHESSLREFVCLPSLRVLDLSWSGVGGEHLSEETINYIRKARPDLDLGY